MSEQHTPGPWIWWTSNGLHRLTAEGGRDGGVLSAVRLRDGFADIVVSEADARLIATSPKLLAALAGFVAVDASFGSARIETLREMAASESESSLLAKVVLAAREAIAEATGGAA